MSRELSNGFGDGLPRSRLRPTTKHLLVESSQRPGIQADIRWLGNGGDQSITSGESFFPFFKCFSHSVHRDPGEVRGGHCIWIQSESCTKALFWGRILLHVCCRNMMHRHKLCLLCCRTWPLGFGDPGYIVEVSARLEIKQDPNSQLETQEVDSAGSEGHYNGTEQ